MSQAPTAAEVLDRLEILWRKLEDEGLYVRANTVSLAIDEIKRLSAAKGALPMSHEQMIETATECQLSAAVYTRWAKDDQRKERDRIHFQGQAAAQSQMARYYLFAAIEGRDDLA